MAASNLLEPLGGALHGVLVSDRAKALNFRAIGRRQICWAHLLRKFIAFAEREAPAGALGRELLDYTSLLFEYWHDYRDGELTRALPRLDDARTPASARTLERAVDAQLGHVSGSCADILAHAAALSTVVEPEGVEPTNIHAERELRAFVVRRKTLVRHTERPRPPFTERLMTVAHTARKQRLHVRIFLTDSCQVWLHDSAPPSLFTASAAMSS